MTDHQNARLFEEEPAWTTHGVAERRNKGNSYSNRPTASQTGNQIGRKWMTHRRRRDYLADHDCRVVLRLASGEGPALEDLAAALDRPARPLFIGRKPCLPAGPIFAGWVDGEDARSALAVLGIAGRAIWPASDGDAPDRARQVEIADLRNWQSGLHGGARIVVEGELP